MEGDPAVGGGVVVVVVVVVVGLDGVVEGSGAGGRVVRYRVHVDNA